MVFPRDHHIGVGEQRLGEDQPGITHRRLVEEAEQLAAASLGERHRLAPVAGRHDIQLQPRPLCYQPQQVGGDPFMLPAGIEHLERQPVRVDTDADRAVASQPVTFGCVELERYIGGCRCTTCKCQQRQKQIPSHFSHPREERT